MNLHVTLLFKEQGVCDKKVEDICLNLKDLCFPTLAYNGSTKLLYTKLCDLADCTHPNAAHYCQKVPAFNVRCSKGY